MLISDFELIKREITLGGSGLIRWPSRREARDQRLEASEILQLALKKQATIHSCKEMHSAMGAGKRTLSLRWDPSPDTWNAAPWDPEMRTLLSHAWTTDPGKLSNESMFFKSAMLVVTQQQKIDTYRNKLFLFPSILLIALVWGSLSKRRHNPESVKDKFELLDFIIFKNCIIKVLINSVKYLKYVRGKYFQCTYLITKGVNLATE